MANRTREILTVLSLLLLTLVSPVIAKCIPLLIATVLIACVLILIAGYVPEHKEKKEPKARPIFTDWDECYLIALDLMQENKEKNYAGN